MRDEPIAILHVVDCLNVGGTERQMFELLRRMDRRRFRPLLATFKRGGELLPSLRELGIEPEVFPLQGSLTQPNTGLQIARMAWMIRKAGVKVVHAHDFYSNVIGVMAAKVARVHALASRRDLAHWLNPTQRRALRMTLALADGVVANAAAVGEQVALTEGVPTHKLRVVPNGIDVARFDRLAREGAELPPVEEGLPRVAMVASMHLPDKGHGDLLEAAAILKARGVRAQWLFVSDGALRKDHEAHARKLGLDRDVCFVGRRTDVPAILERADLVAHPSWAEGFPNAVLEAMCAKKAVVATRVGGIPEVMRDGETGLLVEPKQPAALAERLGELLADPERRAKMGRLGRQRVEHRYSLDRMTITVETLYAALVGGEALPLAA